MASVSLSQLLDEAIGTPEVSVNLEALRKLLKIILGHLSLLGLQDVIPEGAEPVPGQSHPATSRRGPPEEEGRTGTEAGAWDTGEQPPEEDELQGTRSGSPVTSVAADMGQMEKTEPKESGISKVEAFPTLWVFPPRRPFLWSLCPYAKVCSKPRL